VAVEISSEGAGVRVSGDYASRFSVDIVRDKSVSAESKDQGEGGGEGEGEQQRPTEEGAIPELPQRPAPQRAPQPRVSRGRELPARCSLRLRQLPAQHSVAESAGGTLFARDQCVGRDEVPPTRGCWGTLSGRHVPQKSSF